MQGRKPALLRIILIQTLRIFLHGYTLLIEIIKYFTIMLIFLFIICVFFVFLQKNVLNVNSKQITCNLFTHLLVNNNIVNSRILTTIIAILTVVCANATPFEVDGIWYSVTSDQTVCLVPEPSASGSGTSFIIRNVYEGDIVIPDKVSYNGTEYTVTAVENGTFKESPKLTSVSIPATVTELGETPFSACGKLTAITVAADNPAYTNVDGLLYDKAVTTLLACPGMKAGAVVVPSTVTTIAKSAFHGCASITSVDIPQAVNEVGSRAFCGCKKLTGIALPEGVTFIGDSTFYNCVALASLSLPETLTSIGANSFYHCNLLKSIVLPNAVEEIGDRAFNLCYGMTSISIPTNLKRLGYRAFDNCSKLKSVSLPATLTTIESLAFCGCSDLRRIDVAEENNVYRSVDGVLFNKDMTTLVCCPAGKIGDYVVPASVTTIGEYGFYYCRTLQNITLPVSLRTIENHGFRFCSSLKTIVLPPTITTIQHDVFSQCTGLKSFVCYSTDVPDIIASTFTASNYNVPLYVPEIAIEDYQNDVNWQKFASIQPIISELVPGLMGDTDNDGFVTVTDVMRAVNVVIGQTPGLFAWQNADMNFDGIITITDVIGIVNAVLGE